MNLPNKKVTFKEKTFIVYKDVYLPAEDTFILAENLSINNDEKVLDMGCGCGILSILAAENAGKVVAVDINPHATACASYNAILTNLSHKIETRTGDLFEKVKAAERFDVILFNAPYLPIEESGREREWIEKAWCGGSTGRIVIDRFIDEVPKYLTAGGRILLVQSNLSNVEDTLHRFIQHGLRACIMKSVKVPFEKITLIEARHSNVCESDE